jgi:hypothetical protein
MAGLTKRQTEILERIRKDGAVMRDEGGFNFISGETAHAKVVRNLIEKGELVDNDDSLFGPGQTLRAAP